MMNKIILSTLLFFVLIVIAVSCAKVVSPTGGPKDELPPEIISSTPQNYSTNFKDKDIKITFNEYIQIKDINSKNKLVMDINKIFFFIIKKQFMCF